MQYRALGRTGIDISAVTYGGIVSAGFYEQVNYPKLDQTASDAFVVYAIDHGINYFDVAPVYGNAQAQMGNSLRPYRNRVYLACKTLKRDRAGAERDLRDSLALLHTDHLDVYQLHAISSMEDVESAFAPGGVMELMRDLKERGVVAHIGFTAHSEDAALSMLELYDFETVMFPFNWLTHMSLGIGDRLLKAARQRGMGVLGMKSMIERRWDDDAERAVSRFPKSWCKPIEDDAFALAAMRYALSLGVDTLVPPGNFPCFQFAVENIEACLNEPYSDADARFLAEKLKIMRGREFL